MLTNTKYKSSRVTGEITLITQGQNTNFMFIYIFLKVVHLYLCVFVIHTIIL